PSDRSRSVTKTLGQDPPALTIKGGPCGTQVRCVSLLDTSTTDGHPQATRAEEHQNDKRPAPTRVGGVQQGVDGDFAEDEKGILGAVGPVDRRERGGRCAARPRVRGSLYPARGLARRPSSVPPVGGGPGQGAEEEPGGACGRPRGQTPAYSPTRSPSSPM